MQAHNPDEHPRNGQEAASGMSPLRHHPGSAFFGEVTSFGARNAGPWFSRQRCPAS